MLKPAGQDKPFQVLTLARNLQRLDKVMKHICVNAREFGGIVACQVCAEKDVVGLQALEFFGHFAGGALEVERCMLDFGIAVAGVAAAEGVDFCVAGVVAEVVDDGAASYS